MAIGRLFAHRQAFYDQAAENPTNPHYFREMVGTKGQRVCVHVYKEVDVEMRSKQEREVLSGYQRLWP